MTQLRDARLRRALEAAPDALARPPARTRAAILAAAADAVQPWWKRWWAAMGDRRTPWAAALATVVLATLVIVLWQGQEIPGGDRAASLPMPATPGAGAAPPVVAPEPAAVPEPAPEPAAVPPPPTAREGRAARRPQQRPPPAASVAPEESSAAAAPAARDMQVAPAPAPATPVAPALPPPPPAPLAAPARAPMASLRAASGLPAWSRAAIASGGRSVVVARGEAAELAALMARLPFAEGEPAQGAVGASLRIELAEGSRPVGVLEATAGGWRWTPAGEEARPRMLRASTEASAALLREAERLLGR